MLAHELRNPLAPLTNALRLLERSEPLTERGRSALAVAERQRAQLARLVGDLLEVARITRGRIELRCEPMQLNAAVSAAVESLMPAFGHRRQRVAVRQPEQPVRIVADSARVAQILENLLTNASKYTPEGGAIRVEVDGEADVIELRVIDDGLGMEPDKIAGLFELFHQLDATLDRAQGGLGIGLALVKRLVDLHGGSVAAYSAGMGKGACFTVRLPRTV